jgi:hypothetical protein
MYANLRVEVTRGLPRQHPVSGVWLRPDETLYAWAVEIRPDVATAVVHLDANEEGSYAEPAGEREVDLSEFSLRVVADF